VKISRKNNIITSKNVCFLTFRAKIGLILAGILLKILNQNTGQNMHSNNIKLLKLSFGGQ
jgi:hypothetical protein